jgi:Flp pilus assembly protein TadG
MEKARRRSVANRRQDRRHERGSVLAYTVLSVLFLFFAVGLGVDLSHLYLAKTELQNAADAAALAGASALRIPTPERISTAVDRAVSTMNLNKYNFNNRNLSDVTPAAAERALVEFAINLAGPYVSETTAQGNPTSYRFVRVTTPSVPINVLFAIPILGTTKNLNAKATSGLSVPGNVKFCPAPLSAVECDPADPACAFAAEFQGTCPTSGIQTYSDGTTCDPTKKFCKGCTYTIRYKGSTGPSPGNYDGLDCGGTLRDGLASTGDDCKCGNINPGDNVTIDTKTGVNAGPVAQGLNVRFDQYGAGGLQYDPSIPPDTNIAEGTSPDKGKTWTGITWAQYSAGSPTTAPSHLPGLAGRRVLVIPIIKNTSFGGGKSTVQVSSTGAFFMQSEAIQSNGDVKVEYIGNSFNNVVGLDPSGTSSTNVVTPVLYR